MGLQEMVKKELTFNDIKVGLKVLDEQGDIGSVTTIENIHNISVDFNEFGIHGFGIYCLDKNCKDYSPLFSEESNGL